MDQNVLVSIIVPVYNVEAYLRRCVDSILEQTYHNLEVILVDDGAKDSSGTICDEYAARDLRVRVIHKENGGLSSARNAGIDIASGDYLEFVDSDDWIEPDAVESMLTLALNHQAELVIAGRYDVSESTGKKEIGLCPSRQEILGAEEVVGRIFRWDHCDSAACDKLFHRRLFREIRFPLGKVCEDVPVMYRIVLDSGRVIMLNKPIYNYYHREGSISYSAVSEKNFHFSEHTAKIYPYIREHHPAIEKQARYLRVRSLVYSIRSVDLASQEDRKKFADQYHRECRALRKHLIFVLSYSGFNRRERMENVLMAFGLYRGLRWLYHGLR